MDTMENMRRVRAFMDRAFGQGDLSVVEEVSAADGVDHQEPPGTALVPHLKAVVTAMRTAFPDLHFEIHDMLAEGDMVAFRSTMTGTHLGMLDVITPRPLPATGRRVTIPHMHFIRMVDGKTKDLWHLWNMPMMMQQLGVTLAPVPQPQPH